MNLTTQKIRLSGWLFVLLSALLVFSSFAHSDNPSRMYGAGTPFKVEDLPPMSQLRSDIEKRSPEIRTHAMERLHEISFPEQDVDSLRVDSKGELYYEENWPQPIDTQGEARTSEISVQQAVVSVSPSQVFKLHSKPNSSRKVYINAQGYTVTGTEWNDSSGFPVLYMRPFSLDSDYYNFTQAEYDAIAEIWKHVAEDYAPFDIDVTTEAPQSFGPQTGHILISDKADSFGHDIETCTCGGVAYVNVWGRSDFASLQPALVFPDSLSYKPSYIAEAASHELGHNLGLSHDGRVASATNSAETYYFGHGSGNFSWAPIMGVGYYVEVTQWSKGEYNYANNTQDDIAIIKGKLTAFPDDHGNTLSTATTLRVTNETQVFSTTPVNDPDNTTPYNKGIIGDRTDVDVFSLGVVSGTIDLTVTPAWRDAYINPFHRGDNLDILASLLDENGNVIYTSDQNPNDTLDTDAHIIVSVVPGFYYLAIEGRGEGTATTGYTDYGSRGQYYINGTVPPPRLPTTPTIGTATPGNARAIVAFTPGDLGSGTLVNYTAKCGSFTATGTTSPITVTGLTNGTAYTCQVRTTTSVGNSPWSALSNSVTPSGGGNALPDAPTIGIATPGDRSATVSFTPGALGSGTLINYTAQCGGFSTTGTSSPITVIGLTNGTAYTCKVRTSSSVGDSLWSADSNSVTPSGEGNVPPDAPTIGTATAGDRSAIVSFTPGDLGSGTLVFYKSKCGSSTATSTSSPITVTGLTNGTTYTCTVRAITSVGNSPSSAESNPVTPSAGGSTLPTAPAIGTATPGNGRAIVAFTPGNLGSGTLINYTAQCGGFSATGTSSPITVTGLTNGTAYTCKVRTSSSVGDSLWSADSNSVTPSGGGNVPPDAPTIGTATAGDRSAIVSFTPGDLGSGTLVFYKSKCGSSTATSTSSPITVTGLTNGTTYTCTVRAITSVGNSPSSAESNAVTPSAGGSTLPAAPTIGTATPGNGRAIVAFTPGNLGSGTLINYTAQCGGFTATGTSSPLGVTGLTNGTTYTCQVKTTSSVGDSPWSASSNSVTPSASVPAAPTIGTATPGNASAIVAFTPGNLGSGTLINYTAQCGSFSTTGTSSPITVTGLTNGTAYTCKVRTSSSVGDSLWSADSNSVTPSGGGNVPPDAPTIGTATPGDRSAIVSFTPNDLGSGTLVFYKSKCGSSTATNTSSPITVTGLTNGTTYTCTVRAITSVSNSPSSAESNSVTPSAAAP